MPGFRSPLAARVIVETALLVAAASSVAVRPGCSRYSANVMLTCLRETQTEVNAVFASHALQTFCAPCKNGRMKIMLEQIRGDRNLEEIADQIGVAVSTVQRWEKGSMAIPSNRLPAIAIAYGCAISQIFLDENGASKVSSLQDHDEYRRLPEPARKAIDGILSLAGKSD